MREQTRHTMGAALAAAVAMVWLLGGAGQEEACPAAVETALPLEQRVLIPGGLAVGVALKTDGVLVVAKAGQSARQTPLRVGDVILAVEGKQTGSAKMLAQMISQAQEDSVELSVLRENKTLTLRASALPSGADGRRSLGVWVRDSTAGVGTLSYIDPVTGAYGALGHAIVDADTGSMLEVEDGAIMNARITGVTKGRSGSAGELQGSFLKENQQIGTLKLNSVYGIYGAMDETPGALLYPQGLPVGRRADMHTGAATLIATVDDGGPQEYDIEITRCFAQNEPDQKGMILRVTDPRLIEKTGGIVQGMSGSPIIQDGKIVGAVTHVYLSDASRGYGMYIEWMLEQSDRIRPQSDLAA
ncbi:MAG: SpoIVB peptidase [Clostridia bacterium]|nr:SpoIVB peptidase [Clostridia bacterium]